MARVSVASGLVTAVPYLAMVVADDGREFRLVDVEGEVGGSAEVVQRMAALFGDGVDLFVVFDLYAAAFGMTVSVPVVVPGSVGSVSESVVTDLVLGQGVGSPGRLALLARVAAGRRAAVGADSLVGVDAGVWDEEFGVDGAWLPDVRQRFLEASGWEPYSLSGSVGELAEALRVRLEAAADAGIEAGLEVGFEAGLEEGLGLVDGGGGAVGVDDGVVGDEGAVGAEEGV